MPTMKPCGPTPSTPDDPILVEMMVEQARALDSIFSELVGEAMAGGPCIRSTAAYARLALRAQANCRASLEVMARAVRAARYGEEK